MIDAPNTNSVLIMRHIDSLSPAMRALVREYGYAIVRDMIGEGYSNPFELAPILQTWRERRQDEWLATNFISKRTVDSIVNAALYRDAA